MDINICLDCLQKQKPWISKDKVILYSQPNQCNECGESKQLVFNSDDMLFNDTLAGHDIKVYGYPWSDACEKFDFSLGTLANNLGWDKVRDTIMYIRGQEDGKPLAFRTPEEYKPYLDYRVVKLGNRIIIQKRTAPCKEAGFMI